MSFSTYAELVIRLLWICSHMEKAKKGKYTTVHIPTVLAGKIDEIIGDEGGAYSSRSEFIKDAIRRFLEYYGYYPKHAKGLKPVEQVITVP